MIIIVDAYNLLHSVPPYKKTITDKERAQFIARLSAYGRRKGHKVVIVFDGGPYEWPFKEHMKIVTVVYSGVHESADDYIKEYVQAHRAKDLLLVSSDTELNNWAARLNIPSIDSSAFYDLMHQELFTKQQQVSEKLHEVVKLNNNDTTDIDELMIEASKAVFSKSEDFIAEQKKRDAKKHQAKKQERALLKKLNKL